MSSGAANTGAAAGGAGGDEALLNAILQSMNGTVDFQNVANIMGISTAGAAGKRVKRYCEKQTPPIPCTGAAIGLATGVSNGSGGAAPKTPRGKKAAGNGVKAATTPKATKRKSVTEDNDNGGEDQADGNDVDESKEVTKGVAKAALAEIDNEQPATPTPKTPKKKATPKPRTPKAATAKTPKSPKAPKHAAKTTEDEDGDEDMEDDEVDDEVVKRELKELRGMDVDIPINTGSPAKKAKMTTTVAAAVEEAENEELEV